MTAPDTPALLPCPFCGGDEIHAFPPTCHQSTPYDPTDRMYPIVRCTACGGTAEGKCNDGTRDNRSTNTAIAAWNTRAASRAEADALRGGRDNLATVLKLTAGVLAAEMTRYGGKPFTGHWSFPAYDRRVTCAEILDEADAALGAIRAAQVPDGEA